MATLHIERGQYEYADDNKIVLSMNPYEAHTLRLLIDDGAKGGLTYVPPWLQDFRRIAQ